VFRTSESNVERRFYVVEAKELQRVGGSGVCQGTPKDLNGHPLGDSSEERARVNGRCWRMAGARET
jgi:hypothetical protein